MYWDANALYGGTMCEYLPYGGFKFIEANDENIQIALNASPTNDEGYLLKTNLLLTYVISYYLLLLSYVCL